MFELLLTDNVFYYNLNWVGGVFFVLSIQQKVKAILTFLVESIESPACLSVTRVTAKLSCEVLSLTYF